MPLAGYDWQRDLRVIEQGLRQREIAILSKIGFYREYGSLDDPAFSGHRAAIALIEEIAGILAKAATINMDAGFKAPARLIATLRAVRDDLTDFWQRAIEPEALGVLASYYQRGDEPPGQYWFDVTDPAPDKVPSDAQLRDAAIRAIGSLEQSAAKGRPKKYAVEFLAIELRGIFLRFNTKLTIHSEYVSANKQADGGPFIEFLTEVLAPLNDFLLRLPKSYGKRGPLSASYIARLSMASDPAMLARKFHRRELFMLPLQEERVDFGAPTPIEVCGAGGEP
jgi:hypothetical protein